MQETYNIYFAGDIADGESIGEVRRKVGALFNVREATLDKLFSGKRQLIKRNCNQDEALKYQAAMQRAGALATITAAGEAVDSADGNVTPQSAPVLPQQRQSVADLSLAPAGTEVLQPGERREIPRRDVDLSAFSLAAAGERLGTPKPPAPTPPDTSHITVADTGDAIPGLAVAPPPPAPDTSALTLAAPASDLLDARYKENDMPPPPHTDHLSVEPRSHE